MNMTDYFLLPIIAGGGLWKWRGCGGGCCRGDFDGRSLCDVEV